MPNACKDSSHDGDNDGGGDADDDDGGGGGGGGDPGLLRRSEGRLPYRTERLQGH